MAYVRKTSDVIQICHVNIRSLHRNVPANLWQVSQVGEFTQNCDSQPVAGFVGG